MVTAKETLTSEIDSLFNAVNELVNSGQALGSALPIIGNALSGANAPAFFQAIEQQIKAQIALIPDLPSAQDIADKLNELTGGILTATVDGDRVLLHFTLSDTVNAALPNAQINEGNAALGLELSANLSTAVSAGLDLTASFDTATQAFAFVTSASTKELTLGLSSAFDLSGTGKLGFLDVTATDIQTAAPELN